ncbi:MAG: hypothetical protein KJ601_00995 [Nanoarchaeota archaeon]|nr:hypothetical protein [Nanoarchaeota archaeon]MBU1705054.1 hypothetical protein [Nanoarchaeota archaeon]
MIHPNGHVSNFRPNYQGYPVLAGPAQHYIQDNLDTLVAPGEMQPVMLQFADIAVTLTSEVEHDIRYLCFACGDHKFHTKLPVKQ